MGKRDGRRSNPRGIDWRLTSKVRQALRERRVVVSNHAETSALAVGLRRDDLLHALGLGVVLNR